MTTLQVTEIYASIQGESSFAGYPCIFIRLTGCPLRCRWCDTSYGFNGGKLMTHDEILSVISELGVTLVEVTGGEPLAQPSTVLLMTQLVTNGCHVLLETGGSEPIVDVPPEVHIIMDLKAPGSGMVEKNNWSNLRHLKPTDEIKFVLADRNDFDWACEIIDQHQLLQRCKILFSCAWGHLNPKDLAQWMLAKKQLQGCRLQLQQHKYIWGPRAKGV